jgi:hypothetical protein
VDFSFLSGGGADDMRQGVLAFSSCVDDVGCANKVNRF